MRCDPSGVVQRAHRPSPGVSLALNIRLIAVTPPGSFCRTCVWLPARIPSLKNIVELWQFTVYDNSGTAYACLYF
jgi:hypothetical protein